MPALVIVAAIALSVTAAIVFLGILATAILAAEMHRTNPDDPRW